MDNSIFYNISNENGRMEGEIAALKRRIEQLEKEKYELSRTNDGLFEEIKLLNELVLDLEERLQ